MNLLIAIISYRYNLREFSPEIKLLKEGNSIIRQEGYKQSNIQLIEVHFFQEWFHARHEVHVNKRKKKVIGGEVLNKKRSYQHDVAKTNCEALDQVPTFHAPIENSEPSENTNIKKPTTVSCGTIKAIDGMKICMKKSKKYKEDPIQLTMSNCLCSLYLWGLLGSKANDYWSCCHIHKHLWVASTMQFLTDSLTVQKSVGQAMVYELVIKPTYSNKPATQKFDEAFHHLTEDCIKNKFNKLYVPQWAACVIIFCLHIC